MIGKRTSEQIIEYDDFIKITSCFLLSRFSASNYFAVTPNLKSDIQSSHL